MKKLYPFLFLTTAIAQAQIVNIPDANFKAKLLQSAPNQNIAWNSSNVRIKIDANSDGEIQVSEALAVTRLKVANQIVSLVGIKEFANLTKLECQNNVLTTLDVSGMTALTELNCSDNNLTALDVDDTGLTTLACAHNAIVTLDLTATPALQSLNCYDNSLTSLAISGMPNLQTVDAKQNQLASIALTGLPVLTSLDLGENDLVSLDVTALPALQWLYCNNNLLPGIVLPVSAANLKGINCTQNLITSLSLPTSAPLLNALDCSFNQLTSLTIPAVGVLNLNCGHNQITSLSIGTPLSVLDCSYNQLATLTLPPSPALFTLYCDHNLLGALTFTGCPAIQSLNCSYNQLTTLDTSLLPGLNSFDCSHNQIATLTVSSAPGNVGQLFDCSFNQLTSFVPRQKFAEFYCSNNQLATLSMVAFGAEYLHCSDNQLTQLELGANEYTEVSCANNQLEVLDATAVTGLLMLDVSGNDMKALMLTAYVNDYVMLNGNPNLAYICSHPDQIADFQTKTAQLGYATEVNSYCTYTPGAFYHIRGNQLFDLAADGCGPGDLAFPNLKFTITDGTTTGTIICDESGYYDIPVQAATHTLTPAISSPYFTVNPPSAVITFPAAASPFTQDFCIGSTGTHHDLQVSLLPVSASVPGFDATYRILVKNRGTVPQGGTLSFTYDDGFVDYVGAAPMPSAQTSGSVSWSLPTLPVFGEVDYLVTLNLNSPVEVPPLDAGDTVYFLASATAAGEETPYDNTAFLAAEVVNALDPNDKTCLEGDTIGPEMAGKYLHYLIRFENTGNYPAQIVTVEDMIDTAKFDISTLEPLDGSHAYVTRITGNKVEFIFNNIMLPFDDANNDGWVLFRIKTKPTLVLGDSVSNTAGIYFNFNPAVITNTATTTFATMGVDSNFDGSFTLWPNPANDIVNLESKRGEAITSVSIFNALGQELLREKGSDIRRMNVSGLAAGTYIVTLTTDKSKSSTQLIKK